MKQVGVRNVTSCDTKKFVGRPTIADTESSRSAASNSNSNSNANVNAASNASWKTHYNDAVSRKEVQPGGFKDGYIRYFIAG